MINLLSPVFRRFPIIVATLLVLTEIYPGGAIAGDGGPIYNHPGPRPIIIINTAPSEEDRKSGSKLHPTLIINLPPLADLGENNSGSKEAVVPERPKTTKRARKSTKIRRQSRREIVLINLADEDVAGWVLHPGPRPIFVVRPEITAPSDEIEGPADNSRKIIIQLRPNYPQNSDDSAVILGPNDLLPSGDPRTNRAKQK